MPNWPKDGIVTAVYNPPRPDFPYLAVVFSPDGQPLQASSLPTAEAAEKFVSDFMAQAAAATGRKVGPA